MNVLMPSSIYARIFSLRKLGKVRAFYGFLHFVSFSGGYDEHLLANDYETCLGNIMRCRISDRLCRRWWTSLPQVVDRRLRGRGQISMVLLQYGPVP
jgi:hypothetical protein